ncbi:cytochrome P450 [Ceratobasidium sp. AG-I]|nr:cytochrome P450 [Ceratobasidium sp. AG-I]
MPQVNLVLGVTGSWALLTWVYLKRIKQSSLPLPPSPKSDFLVGHLRSMPSSEEHKVYRDWSKVLGSDIISFTVMGQVTIILNSAEAANELLAKRSSIYSDRSYVPMLCDRKLAGFQNITGLVRYGSRWRAQRRISHEVLHKQASKELWPVLLKQSRLTLQRLLEDSSDIAAELQRMSGSILLSTVYGYEVTTTDDPLVKIVKTAIHSLSQAAVPSNFYVNFFPWLKYIPSWAPGAGWKRKADAWRAERDVMLNVPFDWTKEQMASGAAAPSILKRLLTKFASQASQDVEEEDQIRWATGTLFGAGSDTSATSALVFILAMTLYPEVQTKAQAEIDALLGGNRLPELEDQDSLPYVRCLIKEVLRWKSVVPLGIPHASIQDDEYRGYRIPKGAVVIANQWAISNDENVYRDPSSFNPDRFLEPSVPDAPAFGYGRRSCPGVHLAESVLFITISSLLAIFGIQPVRNKEGTPILPTGEMSSNLLVSQPLPFECSITLRSHAHKKLLQAWVDI